MDHFSDYMYWVGELAREYNIQLYITGNSVDHSGPLSLQYCDNTKQSLVIDWHKLFNQYADVIMNLDDCLIWLENVRKEITSNAV